MKSFIIPDFEKGVLLTKLVTNRFIFNQNKIKRLTNKDELGDLNQEQEILLYFKRELYRLGYDRRKLKI